MKSQPALIGFSATHSRRQIGGEKKSNDKSQEV